MSRPVLIKLDEGSKIRWRIVDSDTGAYVDATTATQIVFTFLKPDGTTAVEKKLSLAEITTVTVNGSTNVYYLDSVGQQDIKSVAPSNEKWAQHVVAAAFLTPSDGVPWRLQCRAEFSDGKFSTEEFEFLVKRKITPAA